MSRGLGWVERAALAYLDKNAYGYVVNLAEAVYTTTKPTAKQLASLRGAVRRLEAADHVKTKRMGYGVDGHLVPFKVVFLSTIHDDWILVSMAGWKTGDPVRRTDRGTFRRRGAHRRRRVTLPRDVELDLS